jgi:hypothetical protein
MIVIRSSIIVNPRIFIADTYSLVASLLLIRVTIAWTAKSAITTHHKIAITPPAENSLNETIPTTARRIIRRIRFIQ